MEWTPLENHWRAYYEQLIEADRQGFLSDPELAEEYSYPPELKLAETELDGLNLFAERRMEELGQVFSLVGVNERAIVSYMMNAVLVGMMWEKERIGR